MGKATDEWTFGNVEDGVQEGGPRHRRNVHDAVDTSHQPLETRTAMAYWQNGKLFLHGSTQSTVQTVAVGRALGRRSTPDKVVLISEYTGGGFGSKIPGAISMAIPALLSKKANAPVMMRITREDEHYIGRARPGILARIKVGFARTAASPRSTCSRSATTVRTTRRATDAPPARRSRSPTSRRRCGGAA